MTLVQHSASNHWFEASASDVTLPLWAYLSTDGLGGFQFTTADSGSTEDAGLVPVDGDGTYRIISLADRLYFVTDGASGLLLSTTGTRLAQFVDDGAGGFVIDNDLSEAEGAALYATGDGRYALAAIGGGGGLQMVGIGGTTIQLYS